MDVHQLWPVILLGIVQGIAEFLPISSSGHLVLVSSFLPDKSTAATHHLAMNVALHLGTLGSILYVYRKDLRNVLFDLKMLISIVIATLPIVVFGLTLKDQIESAFETPLVAACGLFVTASLLFLSDWLSKQEPEGIQEAGTPSKIQALLIGMFQAIAIVPGISRSGSTIAGAVMLGQSRVSAARFSFLIAIPAILGATVLQLKDLLTESQEPVAWMELAVGMLVSFVVGIGALELLLTMVRKNRLRYFAVYCLVVALAALFWFSRSA
ncbi:MAG: undecaprenyl-diphosphate phosphatase [Planctomycetaceae bacterium]|nr:undecaprenyl-diphosphate phosphatase [Planctomycetaceae bacterium]